MTHYAMHCLNYSHNAFLDYTGITFFCLDHKYLSTCLNRFHFRLHHWFHREMIEIHAIKSQIRRRRLKLFSVSLWSRLNQFMRQQSCIVTLLVPLSLTALITWLDSITGWELSTFVFYGLPIAIAAWWPGGLAVFLVSLICGCAWWLANCESHPYETMVGFFGPS